MDIRPIKTEQDYDRALQRIETLMDARPGTPEGDELDILATLVEQFEATHHPIDAPDPVEFLKQVMQFHGWNQSDLAAVLNSRSRASEILTRKRPMTLANIRRITQRWHIPADPLIRDYPLTNT